MKFTPLALSGAYLIDLEVAEDDRGFFARSYCEKEFSNHGLETAWVQMNHTLTKSVGTIRGMHFQYPPNAESKIVRCMKGAIWDVIVDLRENSLTLGEWFGVELSSDNRSMIYIPKGFAHGFQSLHANAELLYCHSNYYSPKNEGGLKYNDPDVGIEWPLPITELSDRDKKHPLLKDMSLVNL
ncbi:MAG: dTDP-4-dehydrorhamnose 3,5-epimerase [Gammaproteobacteria bacterium]|nr:dTDP-4-dehydrorhamnose 3,5-epimerase [Gammaproteobacteria bacterium]